MAAPPPSPPAFRYDAFISYNQRADIDLAPHVQAGLQRLAKPWWRMPSIRVFRDKTSLAASPGVWSSIEEQLAQCRWLVLLASPNAARSVWVAKEVEWWLAHRDAAHLLVAVTDGEIVWDNAATDFDPALTTCLPPALAGRFTEEPNWVDLRWAKSRDQLSLRHAQFRAAILDLAAPIHGRPKDELDSEDIRQHRRTRVMSAGAISVIVLLAIGATGAAWIAKRNAEVARANEITALSRQSAAESQLALREGRLQRGFEAALAAWKLGATQEARTALFEAWRSAARVVHVVEGFDPIEAITYGKDGKSVLVWQKTGRLTEWDLAGSRAMRDSRLPLQIVPTTSAFDADGSRVAVGDADGTVIVFDTARGGTIARLVTPGAGEVRSLAFHPNQAAIAVGYTLDPGLRLWDIASQQPMAAQPQFGDTGPEPNFTVGLAFSSDGSRLAAASGMPGASAGVWLTGSGTLFEQFAGAGSMTMHSAVAFAEIDAEPSGTAAPGTAVALGWTAGETSLHTLSGGPARAFNHPMHEDRVTRVAGFDGHIVTTGADGLVRVSSGSNDFGLPPGWSRAENRGLAIDPNHARVAVGGVDGTLIVYALREEDPLQPDGGTKIERVDDGRLLVSRSEPGNQSAVALLDGRTGAVLVTARRGRLMKSGSPRWRATWSADGGLSLLDTGAAVPAWNVLALPPGMKPEALVVAGNIVIARSGSPTVLAFWRLDRLDSPPRQLALAKPTFDLRPTPDGEAVLARSGRELTLIDAGTAQATGATITLPALPEDDRYDIAWSPDGRRLLAGVAGRPLTLYARGASSLTEPPFGVGHGDAKFSADGRWLLSRRDPGRWELRDLAKDRLVFTEQGEKLVDAVVGSGANSLVLLYADGRVQRKSLLKDDEPLLTLAVTKATGVAVGPDGRWTIAFTPDGAVVMDSESDAPPWLVAGAALPVAFAPDGSRAALSMGGDRMAIVLHLPTRKSTRLAPAHARMLDDLAFTSDGSLLATIDKDGNYAVWDHLNGRRIGEPIRGSGEDEDRANHLQRDVRDHVLRLPEARFLQPATPVEWVDSLCTRTASASTPASDSSTPRTDEACRASRAARSAAR